MMARLVESWRVPEDFVGIIRADIVLENSVDRDRCLARYISDDEVRSAAVTGIVDTGARMLFVPQDLVEHLGLRARRTTIVRYADGRREERAIAGPVTVTIAGRSMDTDCIVGPPTEEVLIGQIELERLDLVANCAERTLVPNPESPIYPLLPV